MNPARPARIVLHEIGDHALLTFLTVARRSARDDIHALHAIVAIAAEVPLLIDWLHDAFIDTI